MYEAMGITTQRYEFEEKITWLLVFASKPYKLRKKHLTESELDSRTVVKWVSFDELVQRINGQAFDRVQGKYLKARDVVALREYIRYRKD